VHLLLKYKLGVEEQLAHEEFKNGRTLGKPNYFKPIAPPILLCGLGALVSYKAQSFHVLAVFSFVAFIYFFGAVQKSLGWKRQFSLAMEGAEKTDVQLLIDDKGLRETVDEQVISFAPWSAVKSYARLEKVWLFNLVGGYTAVVASNAIAEAGQDSEQALKAVLKEHSIPQLIREISS
jgi:hypothetical protein